MGFEISQTPSPSGLNPNNRINLDLNVSMVNMQISIQLFGCRCYGALDYLTILCTQYIPEIPLWYYSRRRPQPSPSFVTLMQDLTFSLSAGGRVLFYLRASANHFPRCQSTPVLFRLSKSIMY